MLSSEPIVECVPNFSEGLEPEVVRKIVSAMQVYGVSLLDWSLDPSHHRSVVTIAGPPDAVCEAVVRAVGMAAQRIDLTQQKGVHPRIGAADVVPFVPVRNYTLGQCAVLARHAAMDIWRRWGVPSYLYEAAAMRPDRVKLEQVRQGQFEGLRDAVRKDSARWPDVGGPELHPTAGACAVGARPFLIAYNLYLENADIADARAVAKAIRDSGGGLHGVKAMGVLAEGRVQLSLNITNLQATPMEQVYAQAERLIHGRGAKIVEAELIGLIPEASYSLNANWIRPILQFDPEKRVLERRLDNPLEWPI